MLKLLKFLKIHSFSVQPLNVKNLGSWFPYIDRDQQSPDSAVTWLIAIHLVVLLDSGCLVILDCEVTEETCSVWAAADEPRRPALMSRPLKSSVPKAPVWLCIRIRIHHKVFVHYHSEQDLSVWSLEMSRTDWGLVSVILTEGFEGESGWERLISGGEGEQRGVCGGVHVHRHHN